MTGLRRLAARVTSNEVLRKAGKKITLKRFRKARDGQQQKMTLKEVLSAALTYVGMDADILDEENALQDEDVKLL